MFTRKNRSIVELLITLKQHQNSDEMRLLESLYLRSRKLINKMFCISGIKFNIFVVLIFFYVITQILKLKFESNFCFFPKILYFVFKKIDFKFN